MQQKMAQVLGAPHPRETQLELLTQLSRLAIWRGWGGTPADGRSLYFSSFCVLPNKQVNVFKVCFKIKGNSLGTWFQRCYASWTSKRIDVHQGTKGKERLYHAQHTTAQRQGARTCRPGKREWTARRKGTREGDLTCKRASGPPLGSECRQRSRRCLAAAQGVLTYP